MKKIFFTITLLFALYTTVKSQTANFTLKDSVENVTADLCNSTFHTDFKVYNNTAYIDTLSWSRSFEANWPSAWKVSTCDNNGCYAENVTKMTFYISPFDSATITMTITANGATGNGVIATTITRVGTIVNLKNRAKLAVSACTNIGINEIKKSDIICYPSPFQSNLNINLTSTSNAKFIEFYNILGAVVYKQEIDPSDALVSVNTSNLSKGLYFVSLLDNSKKVLVSKRVEKR